MFPHPVVVEHLPHDVGRSWYYRHRLWAPTDGTIGLNPNMWWSLNILHELSHGAAPRFRFVDGETRASLRHQECHAHGPEWASTFHRVVTQHEPSLAAPLREAFDHYGVALLDDAQFAAAQTFSRRAGLELADEIPEPGRSHALWIKQAEVTQRWEMIGADLGFLLDSLVDGDDGARRWQPLADKISTVLPCTADDIRDLERAGSPLELDDEYGPARATHLKPIALASSVALDIDPLYSLSTGNALAPGDTLPAWTAELNPSWYDELLRCHERAAAMPSRWRHIV